MKSLTLTMFVLFFVGCIGGLENFKPASADEASIKEFFMLVEETWNSKNIDGVLSLYHDNAEIMDGRERIIVSKREYANRLNDSVDGLKGSGTIKYGAPKVKINGDEAEVEITMVPYGHGNVTLWASFSLIRANNGWLILSRTYSY